MNETQNTPELRSEGFTEPWEERKLGEIGEVKTGNTPSTANENYYSKKGTPWITPTDIRENGTYSVNKHLSTEGMSVAQLAPAGSILCTCIASIGKNTFTETTCGFNQQINALIPAHDTFDSYFLFFESALWSVQMKSNAASGTMQIVNKTEFSKLEAMIPSLPEQKIIGTFFSNLDSLITLHQRKYERLQRLKQALLRKMFPKPGEQVPELRFEGFTEPWEQRKFKDIVTIERGGSPRPIEDFVTDSPNGLNWVKIGDAPSLGRYITRTAEKIRPEGLSKTRQVYPGDLILSNSMSFGRPYIMAIEGCIHDGWLLIRDTTKQLDPIYLCQMLGTPQMFNQYRSLAAGSTVNNLNKELVGNAVVPIPCKEEQKVIGKVLDDLDNLVILHQHKYERLQHLKQALLRKMFI